MNRILFVILAGLLVLSIFVSGGCGPCVMRLAPIRDIDIWADESLPPQYFLHVVSGEPSSCDHFDSYSMTRAGNTIRVEVFNLRSVGGPCAEVYTYVEHTIPLGSDFVPGVTYTVEVNDVTETFAAQ